MRRTPGHGRAVCAAALVGGLWLAAVGTAAEADGWSDGADALPLPGAVSAPASVSSTVTAGLDAPAGFTIVVKMDLANGHGVDQLTADFPVVVESALLASRGIYLLRPTDPEVSDEESKVKKLAGQIEKSKTVIYAELNVEVEVDHRRYHHWTEAGPTHETTVEWSGQPAAGTLRLPAAHALALGAGVTVAILDSGIDADHPVLAGKVIGGWDYVDDDADPDEQHADSFDGNEGDDAYGHGTFVAGVVALVAPEAKIWSARVLDPEGSGSAFIVAEAILEAVDAQVDVINLSFGTEKKAKSKIIDEAIKIAIKSGIQIVAAAGNDAGTAEQYPAANKDVLSVTALAATDLGLASFGNAGDWVSVAAPGERVVGPAPGGGFVEWSGTSVAAPFVAGQAALLRSVGLDEKAAKKSGDLIRKTARPLRAKKKLHFGGVDVLESLREARGESD